MGDLLARLSNLTVTTAAESVGASEADGTVLAMADTFSTVAINVALFLGVVGVFQLFFDLYRGKPYSMRNPFIVGAAVLGSCFVCLSILREDVVEGDTSSDGTGVGGFSWGWVSSPTTWWVVGGVVATLVALVAVWFLITRVRRSRARDRSEAERLDRVWAEAVERHDRVRGVWLEHQTDVDLILSLPVLADVADPKVAALVQSLGRAADLAADERPKAADVVDRYADATRDVELKWKAAHAHATRVRLSNFAPGERKRIKTVRRLMAQALDNSASPQERKAFYERAVAVLGDLVRLPEPAVAALESSVRGELTTREALR